MRRPSPAMVVAVTALVAALTGSALALPGRNTVKSGDIAPRNVRASDLGVNAVGPKAANLMRSSRAAGLTQTIATTPSPAGGPAVTVDVPPGALVAVHAQATLRRSGGGAGNLATVHLHEPTALPGAPKILGSESTTAETRYSAPGSGDSNGVASQIRSGWIVLGDVPAGRRTFSLRYATEAGTGLFEDRSLAVAVIR